MGVPESQGAGTGGDSAGFAPHRIPAPTTPCSQCGGPVPLEDGVSFVTCGHCRVPLVVDVGRLLVHCVIRPVVRDRDVRGVIERWLRQNEVFGDPVTQEPVLEFRPYYVLTGADGLRTTVEAAPDLESPDRAAAKAAIDVGRVEPFLPDALGAGEAILPVLLLGDVAAALDESEGAGASQVRLVHIPFWRLRYRVDGAQYTAVVDGVLGEPAALALPPGRAAVLDRFAIAALSCAIAGSTLAAWLLPVWLTIALYLVAGLAAWFWRGSGARDTDRAAAGRGGAR